MSFAGELVELVGADLHRFSIPHGAEGNCVTGARYVGELVHWDGVDMLYTVKDGRDHCAAYVAEEDKVIDFTLRQFVPDAPFPFVGTVDDWMNTIRDVWQVSHIPIYTGKPCDECSYLESLCKCCEYCQEAFCVCE